MITWTKLSIDNNTVKYRFYQDNKALSFENFINLLQNADQKFWNQFYSALQDANSQFPAYFWECPPLSLANIKQQPLEFVVIKAEQLANKKQNYLSFKEHFEENEKKPEGIRDNYSISFSNYGGDAILICPIPHCSYNKNNNFFSAPYFKYGNEGKIGDDLDFKNISEFVKNARQNHQRMLWSKVAEELSKSLEQNFAPKWLNTHGTSVPYLHVMINTKPKYYTYEKYKIFSGDNNLSQENDDSNSFNWKPIVIGGLIILLVALSFYYYRKKRMKK